MGQAKKRGTPDDRVQQAKTRHESLYAKRDKGARLVIPDLVDFSELSANMTGVAKIVLDATQEMLLKIALQAARDVKKRCMSDKNKALP